MNTLKKYFCASRKDLVPLLLWQLAGFFMGLIMVLIINAFINEDMDFAPVGTFFAFLFTFFGVFLRGNQTSKTRLSLAVCMGQTRKSFILFDTVFMAILFLLGIAFIRVLGLMELWLYVRIYPGYVNDIPLDNLFQLPVIMLLCIAVMGIYLFFTMINIRFGAKKSGLIVAVLWIGTLLVSRTLDAAKEGEGGIFAALGRGAMTLAGLFTWQIWVAVGVVLAVCLGVLGILGLRKVEVRL